MIRFETVSFRYGAGPVLSNVSFHVAPGETVVIFGISGSGKSTILKLVAGLIRPQAGRIFVNGLDMSQASESDWQQLRPKIGFVFQGGALFDSMTVGENVGFYLLEHTDKPLSEIEASVRQTLRFLNLSEDLIDLLPDSLSGGMQRRVAIGRAMAAVDPLIMLYDEPTTGLDPIMSDVINELILRTRAQNPVTSVVVTNDMRTARKVADRVMMVYPLARLEREEPQIIFDGTPEELENSSDPRVSQFVNGEAGERLMEMRKMADLRQSN